MSVYRNIAVSVQPVCPIVLHGKMLLHISLHCRTAKQLLTHLRTEKPHVLFCDFPNSRPATLPVRCWYFSLQEDVWFTTVLKQPIFPPPPSTVKSHPAVH